MKMQKKTDKKVTEKLPHKKKSNIKMTEKWMLTLYIAGQTPSCIAAFNNLKKICDECVPKAYKIKIVDLLKQPHLAKKNEILAIPTVIRKLPKPIRKAIGDLSNELKVITGLDFRIVNIDTK